MVKIGSFWLEFELILGIKNSNVTSEQAKPDRTAKNLQEKLMWSGEMIAVNYQLVKSYLAKRLSVFTVDMSPLSVK